MNVNQLPDWNAFPDPTILDRPLISPYASGGWNLDGNGSSGLTVAGFGDDQFKEIGEIAVRTAKGNVILNELKASQIVLKNKTRISLVKGTVVMLEKEHGLVSILEKGAEFLCFACGTYVPDIALQGDHFQSQAHFIARMKAYWKKLNSDPRFMAEQSYNPLFFKMFSLVKERLNMTQFFLKGFVHSQDNLWPLCDRCNGLFAKNDTNPLTFLLQQKLYGEEFIKTLPPLQTHSILIRAGDKQEAVAQFAIRWFIGKVKHQLLMNQLKGELQVKVKPQEQIKAEKRRIRMELAAEDSDSDDEFDPVAYRAAQKAGRQHAKILYKNNV